MASGAGSLMLAVLKKLVTLDWIPGREKGLYDRPDLEMTAEGRDADTAGASRWEYSLQVMRW